MVAKGEARQRTRVGVVLNILVAGITGQLGSGLVEASTDDVALHPVVRRVGALLPAQRVARRYEGTPLLGARVIEGDVEQSLWGLSTDTLERLARQVDVVLNVAGETDWSAASSRLSSVNVRGALHGLRVAQELQQRGGRCVLYCYVSSVHVAGSAIGQIPEAFFGPDGHRTAYERSKWVAEQRLRAESASGSVPVVVARVGGLVGSSTSGETRRRNSLYQLVRAWDRMPRKLLPTARGGRVDMLPRDVAGDLLLRALRTVTLGGSEPPAVLHVCAGEAAPTFDALVTTARSLDRWDEFSRLRTVRVPRGALLRGSENFDRVAQLHPAMRNAVIGVRYLAFPRWFERSRLRAVVGGTLPAPSVEELARFAFGFDSEPLARWSDDPDPAMARFAS